MTKQEYADYCARVEHYLKGVEHVSTGSCPGCGECGHSDDCTEDECYCEEEGGFSWSQCEVCGSSLGGNRYAAHGCLPKKDGSIRPDLGREIVHFEVCEDCVYYLNYGRLDDTTMMELEG